jgi:hypothetical protein
MMRQAVGSERFITQLHRRVLGFGNALAAPVAANPYAFRLCMVRIMKLYEAYKIRRFDFLGQPF